MKILLALFLVISSLDASFTEKSMAFQSISPSMPSSSLHRKTPSPTSGFLIRDRPVSPSGFFHKGKTLAKGQSGWTVIHPQDDIKRPSFDAESKLNQ